MMGRSLLLFSLFISGVVVTDCRKASLGLTSIFNKFVNVTDLVGGMPDILQKITADIVDDVRDLLPKVQDLLDKHNLTEVIVEEIGKALNMTRITHDLIPELEKIMRDNNITQLVDEIVSYIEVSTIRETVMPAVEDFLESNDVSQAFSEIREYLNVTRLADELLPEFEKFVNSSDLKKIVREVKKFLDIADVKGHLIPTLEKIFESGHPKEAIAHAKKLLNITHISNELLPELDKAINESNVHEIITEVKKFMNITRKGGELLDELQKLLDESNITHDVPDLKPFIDISIIREKLPEIQRILDHSNISQVVDEIERLLNVSYVRVRLPELEEMMEDLGITRLLTEIKKLFEIKVVSDEVSQLEEMLEDLGVKRMTADIDKLLKLDEVRHKIDTITEMLKSGNLSHLLLDVEQLLDADHIRAKIVPEIEEIWERSNVTEMIDMVEKLLNASFLNSDVVPEIEKFLETHNITERLRAFFSLFRNTTFLKETVEKLDKDLNISRRGERISNGGFADVVNEVLDEVFKKDNEVVEKSTIPPTQAPKTTSGPTAKSTIPPVCINDCEDKPCGTAIINSCGNCVKGTTGRDTNYGKDCNNVCGGKARNDSCGACTNPPKGDQTGKDSPFVDCHGICFGIAKTDSCGICTGGKTGFKLNYTRDACGVCGGDNSTCKGCDGVPNSGKANDSCNVCGGDGSSCTAISTVVPSLLPATSSASSRIVDVLGAGLDGDDIKCVFAGVESKGTKVDRTHCKCTIPSGGTVGSNDFTVKVVKSGADIATSVLQITLYDATAVKITGMTPSEMATKKTTEVTFSGPGFDTLDSSAAVCIIGGTKKLKAALDGSTYKCTVPEFEKSVQITLALSLNGVHDLTSDVSLTRTVYAGAPSLTKAQLSNTGALLNVKFDKDVDRSTLASCGAIFDSASVQLLGTSPDCSWSDGRHLTITPGAGVTVVAGSSLTLKADAVKSGGEKYSKYASGSVSVSAPTSPEEPESFIVGPTQISSCGHLTLDGSQSSGGGGRDLKYKWSLVGTTDAKITAELDKAEDKSKVFINGTLMTAGSTYKFKLAVKNFLGSTWKESFITITKASNPLPEVRVEGPLRGRVLAARSFFITAMAKAASCSSSKALTFTWTVTCTNDDSAGAAKIQAESSSGFRQTSSKSALKIDAGTLVGGKEYEFTVVVALKASSSIATTVTTTVNVEWSPLEPSIVGGDRTVGRDSGSLVLDAKTSTVDPDNADGDLSCSWICEDNSNQQPCFSAVNKQTKIAFPNKCVITVAKSEFAADNSYKIKSEVSKGSRTASSSILLTVIAGKPPAVRVLKPNIKVLASQKVALRGIYNSTITPTKVEWISAQDESYRYINLSDTTFANSPSHTRNPNGQSFVVQVLKPNVLTPGASYKFILNVNDGTKVGSSNMVVEVRSGPTSGTFEVTPTILEELNEITLTASLWVTESDAYPLEYEFGFVDDSGVFQPWATQASNEYKISAPPGYGTNKKLTLKMKVKDAFGSRKWMEKIITVNPATTVDEQKVEDLINSRIQEAKDNGDYSKAVPEMMNILQAVKRNSLASTDFAKKVTNSTVNTLLLAVNSTSLDEEKAKPMLKTFLVVKTDYIEQPKDVLGGFKKIVKASKKNLDKETVEDTLKWVGDLSSKTGLTDKEVLKNIASVDDSLASSLGEDVEFGQPAVETSADNPRVVIKVAHTGLEGNIATKTSNDATAVEFGNELSDKFGVWECAPGVECMGVILKMINYKEDYYSELSSTKPSILTDKIVSISLQNPETGDDLAVNGLGEPIKLTFNTGSPSSGKKLVCYYYSETDQKWSSEGMTWTLVSGVLKVSVTHLTSFSPAEEETSSSDKVYQVSFVLSNTTWKESYLDTSSSDSTALKTKVLQEFNEVYKNDTTLKSVNIERFEKYGNNVKVVLKASFSPTNTNPSEKLKLSIADGKLGDIAVDPSSLDWVEVYDKSDEGNDDKTKLIIGIVVGVSVLAVFIAIAIAWMVYKTKQKSKVRSHTNFVNEYDNRGRDDHELAPI